jgi:Protein of unknown function (DUF2815)
MKIQIPNVRLSYSRLFNPKRYDSDVEGGEPRLVFEGNFILEPTHPSVPDIQSVIETVAKEKWPKTAAGILSKLKQQNRVCLHEQELTDKLGNTRSGYEGMFYLSASNRARPTVVNRRGKPVTEADGIVYDGCYGMVILDIYALEHVKGNRISADLQGFQFMRDGDAFTASRVADPSEFADLGDQGEEADFDPTA